MSNSLECALYFKERPEYGRCFGELRKKWKSYGRAAGRVTLKNASREECRAIAGIVGRCLEEGTILFSVAEFEKGLQRTRFAPVELGEVLSCYFGEELATNQEQKRREQEKKEQFFEELTIFFEKQAGGAAAAEWLRSASETKKHGYQLMAKEYAKSACDAGQLIEAVARALNALAEELACGRKELGSTSEKALQNRQMLAVFAAKISGNPHYFDRGTAAGQLLLHAICFYQKRELPKNAHGWRERLLSVGIMPDNVSSSIHAYGLRLRTADGYHPAYEVFCARKEPCVITLENLQGVIGAEAVGDTVYVVENEMVFSYLAECARENAVTLLCTSGQPRAAALELFSFIAASGVKIYYSGDIDPEGIDIADRLWQQYGDVFHIWRMEPEDYEKSISAEVVDEIRLAKLSHIRHPVLKETARCVREKKCAGYQENLLEELVGDVSR